MKRKTPPADRRSVTTTTAAAAAAAERFSVTPTTINALRAATRGTGTGTAATDAADSGSAAAATTDAANPAAGSVTTPPVADHGVYNSDSDLEEDDTSVATDPGTLHTTQFSSRSPSTRSPKISFSNRTVKHKEVDDNEGSEESDGEEDGTDSEESFGPATLEFNSPTAAVQLAASVLQAHKLAQLAAGPGPNAADAAPPAAADTAQLATTPRLADTTPRLAADEKEIPVAAPPRAEAGPHTPAAAPPPAAADTAQLADTTPQPAAATPRLADTTPQPAADAEVVAAATPRLADTTPRLADAENAAAPLAEARNLPRLPVPPADSSSLSYMPEAAAAPLAVAPPHVTTQPGSAAAQRAADTAQLTTTPLKANTQVGAAAAPLADTTPQPAADEKEIPVAAPPPADAGPHTPGNVTPAVTTPPAAADADTAPQRATTPPPAAATGSKTNFFSVPRSAKKLLRRLSLIAQSKDSPAAAAVTPPTSTLGNSFSTRSGTQTTPVAATSQDSQALNKLKGLAKIYGRSYVTSLESQFAVVFKSSTASSSEGEYELYRDGQILNDQTEKNKFNDDLGKFRKSVGDDDYIYDRELATSLKALTPDSIKTKIDELLSTIPAIQNQTQTQTNADRLNQDDYKADVKNRLTIEYAGFLSPYSSCQHSVTIAEREEFFKNILQISEEENKDQILKALKNLSLDNLASKEDRRLNLDLNILEARDQESIYKIHSNTNSGRVQAEIEYINFKEIAKRIATEPLEGESKSDKESPTDLVHFHLIDNYFSGGDQGSLDSNADSNDNEKNKALIIFHAHKDSSTNQYSYKQSIISGEDIQKFEDTIKEKQKYISLSKIDNSAATEEKTIDQIKEFYEEGVKAYISGQVIGEESQTTASHKKLAIALVAQDFLDCQVFSDKYISKAPETSNTELNQAASSQDSSSSKLQNDLDRKFDDIAVPHKQYHALGGIFQKGITITRHQDEVSNQGSTESAQEADKFVNVVNVWDKSSTDQQKSSFVAINNPPYQILVKGENINATFFRKIAFTKEGKIRFSKNIYYEDGEGEKKFFKIEAIDEGDDKKTLLNDLAALKIKTTYVAMDKNEIKTLDKSYTGFNKDSQKFFNNNYEVKQPAADIRSAASRNVAEQTNPLRQGGVAAGKGV